MKYLFFTNTKQEKGSAIFFAVIVGALVLGIAVGGNILVFGELRILRGAVKSTVAIYAAEAGIEHLLFLDSGSLTPCYGDVECLDTTKPSEPTFLTNIQASYEITVKGGGVDDCDVDATYCAQSEGVFEGGARKIEIER